MPTISKPWRRFSFVHPEAAKLGLKPRFKYFERLIAREPEVLVYNHLWQRADITDDAREILLKQPFKAKLIRAPDPRETLGFCIIFDKFNAEFRERYDKTPLIVAPKSVRDDWRCQGKMRFTQRFLSCEGTKVRVSPHGLISADSWLPECAMWYAAYDERYPHDPMPRKKKPKPVAPSEPVVEEMLPEDAEALLDLDLDL